MVPEGRHRSFGDNANYVIASSNAAARISTGRPRRSEGAYANVYRIKGVLELGSADIDNLEEVVPWAKDFEEHVGIVEIRLLPDTAGKSGADALTALQQQEEGK